MPTYENPNNHTVDIAIANPRTTLRVFPRAWPARQMTDGAKQTIELDASLAKTFVQLGMLVEKHVPSQCESCRLRAEAAVKTAPVGIATEGDLTITIEPDSQSTAAENEAEPSSDISRIERKKVKAPALESKPASPPAPARNDKPAASTKRGRM